MKASLAFTFLLAYFVHYAKAAHSDLCRVLADGTQFRRPDTCNEYIVCTNQTAEVFSCGSPTMYDRNRLQCAQSASDCEKNYCAASSSNGKWVANPNNCNGFYYCSNGVAHPGYCQPGFHFDAANQLCTYESTSNCFEVSNICDFVPEKTKIRNEQNCATYFQCTNGKKSEVKCGKDLYFDVERGACNDKTITPCRAHPKPNNVCGTATRPSHGFKADGATCRGFFYCQNLGIVQDVEPTWGQCPEGLFFNAEKKTCTEPLNAICTYNRCEGRGTMYVQSGGKNCREYIICENGIPIDKRTCQGDKFFDEKRQACVTDIISYDCCDEQP